MYSASDVPAPSPMHECVCGQSIYKQSGDDQLRCYSCDREYDDVNSLDTIHVLCPWCSEKITEWERYYPGGNSDSWAADHVNCPNCDYTYEIPDDVPGVPDYNSGADINCTRCKSLINSGGVEFKSRQYCDDCVRVFEQIAESGVVVRSRHGHSNFHEKPYVVTGDGGQYIEHSQTEALARGKELAEELGTRGLFIYWKRGSHWVLQTYLEEHPRMASDVEEERRQLRGRTPIKKQRDGNQSNLNIRAEGDAIVNSTVVEDAVVNRSTIAEDQSE